MTLSCCRGVKDGGVNETFFKVFAGSLCLQFYTFAFTLHEPDRPV